MRVANLPQRNKFQTLTEDIDFLCTERKGRRDADHKFVMIRSSVGTVGKIIHGTFTLRGVSCEVWLRGRKADGG